MLCPIQRLAVVDSSGSLHPKHGTDLMSSDHNHVGSCNHWLLALCERSDQNAHKSLKAPRGSVQKVCTRLLKPHKISRVMATSGSPNGLADWTGRQPTTEPRWAVAPWQWHSDNDLACLGPTDKYTCDEHKSVLKIKRRASSVLQRAAICIPMTRLQTCGAMLVKSKVQSPAALAGS